MSSNFTSYFLPTDANGNGTGYLRHAHGYYTQDHTLTYNWHPASQVHSGDPDAHTVAQSWLPGQALWAKVNVIIPTALKSKLIAQAKEYHDARS